MTVLAKLVPIPLLAALLSGSHALRDQSQQGKLYFPDDEALRSDLQSRSLDEFDDASDARRVRRDDAEPHKDRKDIDKYLDDMKAALVNLDSDEETISDSVDRWTAHSRHFVSNAAVGLDAAAVEATKQLTQQHHSVRSRVAATMEEPEEVVEGQQSQAAQTQLEAEAPDSRADAALDDTRSGNSVRAASASTPAELEAISEKPAEQSANSKAGSIYSEAAGDAPAAEPDRVSSAVPEAGDVLEDDVPASAAAETARLSEEQPADQVAPEASAVAEPIRLSEDEQIAATEEPADQTAVEASTAVEPERLSQIEAESAPVEQAAAPMAAGSVAEPAQQAEAEATAANEQEEPLESPTEEASRVSEASPPSADGMAEQQAANPSVDESTRLQGAQSAGVNEEQDEAPATGSARESDRQSEVEATDADQEPESSARDSEAETAQPGESDLANDGPADKTSVGANDDGADDVAPRSMSEMASAEDRSVASTAGDEYPVASTAETSLIPDHLCQRRRRCAER